MPPSPQKSKFTFTWQFHNFSMCPLNNSELVCSPVFVVKLLGNSEWQLMFYPKGDDKHEKSLSCFLYCMSSGSNINVAPFNFSLVIESDNAKKRVIRERKNQVFQKMSKSGFSSLMSTEELYSNEKAYLPNDTLTIKCSMWRCNTSETSKGETRALSNKRRAPGIELNSQFTGERNDCSATTRVEVQSKTISWAIKHFSSISFGERLTIPVNSAIKESPSFTITLYKSFANHSVEIEIQREFKSVPEQTFLKCKASVFHAPKGARYAIEDEHLFLPEFRGVWKLPTFIQLEKLKDDKYFINTSNVLHLRLEFSYSRFDNVYYIENSSFLQYGAVNFSEPIEEFKNLYEVGKDYDVVIRVGNRDFKVLKSILKARSPVFDAMFDNDMKEKTTGVVDIGDIDEDTLDKMLAFMYSNALEDLQSDDAIRLYSAADKYQVLPLKVRCSWILATYICVSNVCDVLILAERHNDEFMRDCAENFIRSNSLEVLKSKEWRDFIKDFGTVAANVMLKMLTS